MRSVLERDNAPNGTAMTKRVIIPKTREECERLSLEDPEMYAGEQDATFHAKHSLKTANGDPLVAEELVPRDLPPGYRKWIVDLIWDIAGEGAGAHSQGGKMALTAAR
jgi:hypothetical protein